MACPPSAAFWSQEGPEVHSSRAACMQCSRGVHMTFDHSLTSNLSSQHPVIRVSVGLPARPMHTKSRCEARQRQMPDCCRSSRHRGLFRMVGTDCIRFRPTVKVAHVIHLLQVLDDCQVCRLPHLNGVVLKVHEGRRPAQPQRKDVSKMSGGVQTLHGESPATIRLQRDMVSGASIKCTTGPPTCSAAAAARPAA